MAYPPLHWGAPFLQPSAVGDWDRTEQRRGRCFPSARFRSLAVDDSEVQNSQKVTLQARGLAQEVEDHFRIQGPSGTVVGLVVEVGSWAEGLGEGACLSSLAAAYAAVEHQGRPWEP